MNNAKPTRNLPLPAARGQAGQRTHLGCRRRDWLVILSALPFVFGGLIRDAAGAPGSGSIDAAQLVAAARRQVGVTVGYDPAYRVLAYPGGDVPLATGVCTDVLTRALREQGLDLQQALHEDMRTHFARYPHTWGLRAPDANIDHRRVPNLMTFFARRGWGQPITARPEDYRPGDVVTWNLGGGVTHVGLVSDRKGAADRPLVLHNIGRGTQEEDVLFAWKVTGHYRLTQGN